jgi:hypothetical protein
VRAAVLLVSIFVGAQAQADDRTSVTASNESEPAEPALVGANFHSLLEGVGASETTTVNALALGPRARAFARASLWSNEIDANSSGWSIAAGVTRDLGAGFKLELNGSYDHLDGRFGGRFSRGSAATVGARIVRYFPWSRGRVAWIAFGIESTIWLGEARLAEPAGTFVGLHVGTTF